MVFVNSMSDLFHEEVPDSFIHDVFSTMLSVPRHTYQILTKRPARALRFVEKHQALLAHRPVPSHIWMGTSIEDQSVAYREKHLRQIPADVRFLSCEPLIGPIELSLKGIRWVIVGGESGVVRRTMNLEWARSLRDQCTSRDVAFFFKQVGGRTPKAGGRLLDGRTWDQFPAPLARALA